MKHNRVISCCRHIAILAGLFITVTSIQAQNNFQDEYLKSDQNKGSFNDSRYKGLKQKMMQESGTKPGNGNFNPDNFTKPGSPSQESNYGFEPEEYKGEYDSYYPKEQGSLDAEPSKSSSKSSEAEKEQYDSEGYSHHSNKKEKTFDDYNKEKEKSSETFKPLKNKLKSKAEKPKKTEPPTSGEVQLMQILLIILGAALVAFLIYYFFLRYNANDKGAKIVMPEEEKNPMEIPKSELERRLEVALAQQNFREAVRLYFIFIIKELAEKEWIRWEKEKTNIAYLIEMRKRPQYGLFNQSVILFEWVWYGQYEITEQDFQGWEPLFKKLLNELKN
jgi:hypothetical protein